MRFWGRVGGREHESLRCTFFALAYSTVLTPSSRCGCLSKSVTLDTFARLAFFAAACPPAASWLRLLPAAAMSLLEEEGGRHASAGFFPK